MHEPFQFKCRGSWLSHHDKGALGFSCCCCFAGWPGWCSSHVQCSCCRFSCRVRQNPEPLRAQFLIRPKANQTSQSNDREARPHPHPRPEAEPRLRLQKRCSSRVRRRCMWPSAATWSATGARRSHWSRRCTRKAAWASLSSTASAMASATPSTSRATCAERREPSSRARSASPGASPQWPTRWPALTYSHPPARSACSVSSSAAASPLTWTESLYMQLMLLFAFYTTRC